jgi:hypothetical protein
MENGPVIDDFPINTSIYKGFSMAMLNKPDAIRFTLRPSTCLVGHLPTGKS